jgi:hypothetical protein
MLMQEEMYKKHMLNLKNMKPAVDSGLNKTQNSFNSTRIVPMNSTMYSNKNSAMKGRENSKV